MKSLQNIKGERVGKELDYKSIEVYGIDMNDYPDFVDAFISEACWEDGSPLTDAELDALNEDSSFVYERVIERVN